MMTRPNDGYRIASPQAWRRFWKHVSHSEAADIAADVAAYVSWAAEPLTDAQVAAVVDALRSFPWDQQKQATR